MAYSIAANDDLDAATIHWHPGDIDTTAEEVFASSAKRRGPDAIECRAAADWLSNLLAINPQPAAWIAAEAKQYSFHPRITSPRAPLPGRHHHDVRHTPQLGLAAPEYAIRVIDAYEACPIHLEAFAPTDRPRLGFFKSAFPSTALSQRSRYSSSHTARPINRALATPQSAN